MTSPPRPRLRIREVAERAGVSASTVSHVLNGTAIVRASKREPVLAVIDELGYRPNRVASNLRRQQVQMIGVVVPDIRPCTSPRWSGQWRTRPTSVAIACCSAIQTRTTPNSASTWVYWPPSRVAGAIIAPTDAAAPEISELLDYRISVVSFDRAVADRRADAVLAANVDGARLGTEHLIEGGHARIGLITGPVTLSTGSERLLGYEQAVTAARASFAGGSRQLPGGRWQGSGDRVVGGRRKAHALLVANNLMAIGALQALKDAHLKVPTDVALLSIDDPPWASFTDPPLTTLAQPVRAMADRGSRAVAKTSRRPATT